MPAPIARSESWSWRRKYALASIKLPSDGPQSLDIKHVSEGAPAAYPNGCHVCEVEVDPDTGRIEIVKYTAVNDFGTVINPDAGRRPDPRRRDAGLGQTLLEHTVYDEQGQLLSGSYMDYALPRADHAPDFAVLSHPVPAKTNPLGVKGCGEAGCAGSLTSIMNAVVDALVGLRHQAYRHAGDPAARLAGDPERKARAVTHPPSFRGAAPAFRLSRSAATRNDGESAP